MQNSDMSTDPIAALEYETLVFGRHLTDLPGRSRRAAGVLDQSAYTLLTILDVRGPQSIAELGAVVGLDASTLNRQTAALVRDGYAERITDPDGGIARKFAATPLGTQSVREERDASRAALADTLNAWPEQEVAALNGLLSQLNIAIEERTGRHWPR